MNRAAVVHRSGGKYAFPIDNNTLKLRLKAAKNDLQTVKVVFGSRYDGQFPHHTKEMELSASDSLYDYFEVYITLKDKRFRYLFYLKSHSEELWFTEKGFSRTKPKKVVGYGEYFQYSVINDGDIFLEPDWVQDTVFYQIFPERFMNGNLDNDPAGVEPWGDKPGRDLFFGGDLEGIIEKLDYLNDLGINGIYLTPIFKSTSNHKYNIDDYFQIDSTFGNKKTIKDLVNKAHQLGIRVILDAVFNHCGFNFFAFKDLREKGTDSKYQDWFFVDNYPVKITPPVNYSTFANNVVDMPRLNTANPEVQEYLLDVIEYWLKEIDIDGWRLDVADEVEHDLWRKFRQRVRTIKPDAYIVGEIWHNAEDWLQGDQFDGIMNYPLAMAVFDFFAYGNIGPGEFNNRLVQNWMLYQDTVNYNMLNLLDSHDTTRLKNIFTGDKELMKLAVVFQFTYPGAPMIYYGDEIGMEGEDDPDCRRCMIWDQDQQDLNLYKYYKKLVKIRGELISLRRGNYRILITDEVKNTYGFIREFKDEKTVVIFNNSPYKQRYRLNGELFENNNLIFDHLNDKSFEIENNRYIVEASKYSALILN